LIVPNITLEAKTKSMYGALVPADFGEGTTTSLVVEALGGGRIPSSPTLRNSFTRVAGEKHPQLLAIWKILDLANVGPFALTGAGPATSVLVDRNRDRFEVARSLRAALPSDLRVIETAFRSQPLTPQLEPLG
jgi:4-diphosphocytidyl-2C-methyl-D-erythritol kinase